MKTASRLLGRKFDANRLRRHREALARRKAGGFYERESYRAARRDPRTKTLTVMCAYAPCGKRFEFTFSPRVSRNKKRYCSHDCQVRNNHELRRKCPSDYETLYDLYVTKNMSTVEIGKMFGVGNTTVGEAMRKAGVPARKSGPRKRERVERGTVTQYNLAQPQESASIHC